MINRCKSLAWYYANKCPRNKTYCDLCSDKKNNEFCCFGGTTRSLSKYFIIHITYEDNF